jgi:uncharacterized protein (DUF2336 family)
MSPMIGDAEYEEAKRLARGDDLAARRTIAGRADMRPEILYYLAEDKATEVRRAIAGNDATPHQADELLVRDRDEAVRAELAQKVARLLPGLTADAQDEASRRVIAMLEKLAQDEAVRVRAVVAEAVRNVDNVPPEMIKRLARDAELIVASPVLRFSPLLTDEDLLDIITSGPQSGALAAIAQRRDVRPRVSDALVAADDEPAVAALLANKSAQIREETLDLIVERAASRSAWHEPLVKRPSLPARAARRIAGFVTEALLSILKNREDLPRETREQVTAAVAERLAAAEETAKRDEAKAAPPDDDEKGEGESVEEKVTRLKREGTLDEDAVDEALHAGQRAFVRAALAVLAEVPVDVVDKILAARSAKGVVALVWKAKLPMRLAVQIQTRLGGIAPRQALQARSGTVFPLTADEMTWQIEFFGG